MKFKYITNSKEYYEEYIDLTNKLIPIKKEVKTLNYEPIVLKRIKVLDICGVKVKVELNPKKIKEIEAIIFNIENEKEHQRILKELDIRSHFKVEKQNGK